MKWMKMEVVQHKLLKVERGKGDNNVAMESNGRETKRLFNNLRN